MGEEHYKISEFRTLEEIPGIFYCFSGIARIKFPIDVFILRQYGYSLVMVLLLLVMHSFCQSPSRRDIVTFGAVYCFQEGRKIRPQEAYVYTNQA